MNFIVTWQSWIELASPSIIVPFSKSAPEYLEDKSQKCGK